MNENQHQPGETFTPDNHQAAMPPSENPSSQPEPTTQHVVTPNNNSAASPVTTAMPVPPKTSPASVYPEPHQPAPTTSLPTPANTYAGPEPTPAPSAKKPKGKLKVLLISLAVVLIFSGAGAFAYLGVYLPNQPENVVKAMLANSLTADTSKSDGELVFSSGENEFKVKIASATDVSDITNPKMLVKLSADVGVTDILVDYVMVDREVYFKIDGLDGLSEILTSQLGASSEQAAPITEVMEGVFGHWFVINESMVKQAVDFSKITEAEIEELKLAAKDIELLEIAEVLADEEVRGESAFHYRLRPNDQGAKLFLDNIKGKTIAGQEITDSFIEEAKRYIDENPSEPDETVEVWVYKGSKQLAKIYSEPSEELDISGSMTFEFFDYGEPVTIEKPENAKSLLELGSMIEGLIGEYFGSMSGGLMGSQDLSGGTEARARDTERRTDVNSLATYLEVYYADNGYYPQDINVDEFIALGLAEDALIDPDGNNLNSSVGYKYQAAQCNSAKECERYVLSVKLEADGELYEKQSLN